MSALDIAARKVRVAITEYDLARAHERLVKREDSEFDQTIARVATRHAASNVIGETERLLTILDQQREPI